MGDYTVKNLRSDVEDMAPKFDMSPEVEARFARDPLESRNLALSYQRLAPNARQPFGHRHEEQEEVYVVLEGSGRAKLDDELQELDTWDALRIAPDVVRCLEAGREGMTFVAIGAPRTEQNDADMIQGWWAD